MKSKRLVRVCCRRLGVEADEAAARLVFDGAVSSLAQPLQDKCKFQYFVAGKRSNLRGLILGRFYAACTVDAADALIEALKRTAQCDEQKGFEECAVDLAPFDKVLREPSHRDKREGTWELSEEYASFLAHKDDAEPMVLPKPSGEVPNALLEFLKNKTGLFNRRRGNQREEPPKQFQKKQKKANAKPQAGAKADVRSLFQRSSRLLVARPDVRRPRRRRRRRVQSRAPLQTPPTRPSSSNSKSSNKIPRTRRNRRRRSRSRASCSSGRRPNQQHSRIVGFNVYPGEIADPESHVQILASTVLPRCRVPPARRTFGRTPDDCSVSSAAHFQHGRLGFRMRWVEDVEARQRRVLPCRAPSSRRWRHWRRRVDASSARDETRVHAGQPQETSRRPDSQSLTGGSGRR